MRSICLAAAGLAALLWSPFLSAQGMISDGDATWAWSHSPGMVDFRPDDKTDHLYQCFWWYRDGSTGPEAMLPFPAPEQLYVQDRAIFQYDLDDFEITMVTLLEDGLLPDQARASQVLFVKNVTQHPITLSFFSYVDFDLEGVAGEEGARLTRDGLVEIFSKTGCTASIRALGADAFQVASYPVLLSLLDDQLASDLDGSGLPFAFGDCTAAFQWDLSIPPSVTAELYLGLAVNMTPPGEPARFVRGDANGDGSVMAVVDAVYLLTWGFAGGAGPPCREAADADNNRSVCPLCDGTYLLNYEFLGGPPPPAPGIYCGTDPDPVFGLGCENPPDACLP